MLSLSKHWLSQHYSDNLYSFYQKSPLINNLLFDKFQFTNITIYDLQLLISPKTSLHYKLLIAAKYGLLQIVKYLYSSKPSGACISCEYNPILELAAEKGHLEIVKYLVSNGANIHTSDDYPVRWAAYKGHFEIVKYLAGKGANIREKDNFALKMAVAEGHMEIILYLQSLFNQD